MQQRNWSFQHAQRAAMRCLVSILGCVTIFLSLSAAVYPTEAEAASHRDLQEALDSCTTSVSLSAPASNLGDIVDSSDPGTCFVLAAGFYRFHDVQPKSGMLFVGTSTSGVTVDGTGHENAFHGTSSGVTIARMTLSNFNASGGFSRQEQAPIRGTARIWASTRGEMATDWLIAEIHSHSNYAAGLLLGDHFTVLDSEFSNNGVTGIAGDEIVGGFIANSIIHSNGSAQASGAYVNGGGIKLTQAGSEDQPVVVSGNNIHHNDAIGLWCDVGCRGLEVLNNTFTDHRSRAIMFELSTNMLARGNQIIDSNEWTGYQQDFSAGAITVGESSDVVIEQNSITNAASGVLIRQTDRPTTGEEFLLNYDFINYAVEDVVVRNNTFVNVDSMGVSSGSHGTAPILRPESIEFTQNSYQTPEQMDFWWLGNQKQSFTQWQGAGRDIAGDPPVATTTTSSPPTTTTTTSTSPPSSTSATTTTTLAETTSTTEPESTTTQPSSSPTGSSIEDGVIPTTTAVVVATPPLPLRINAGGEDLINDEGVEWSSDRFFLAGSAAVQPASVVIDSTTNEQIYRSERSAGGYEIPVPEGRYELVLHFVETSKTCQKSLCRLFTVQVENSPVISDLDIFDRVGGFRAMTTSSSHFVSDGALSLNFSAHRYVGQVSAIEIRDISGKQAVLSGTAISPSESATSIAQVDEQTEFTDHSSSQDRPHRPSKPPGKTESLTKGQFDTESGSLDLVPSQLGFATNEGIQGPILDLSQHPTEYGSRSTSQPDPVPLLFIAIGATSLYAFVLLLRSLARCHNVDAANWLEQVATPHQHASELLPQLHRESLVP